MKIKINRINILIYLSSIISFMFTLNYFYNFANGYSLMVVFPIVYFIMYFITIGNVSINKSSIPVLTYTFLLLQWLRYVLMPPIIAISGENAGTAFLNPSEQAIALAVNLMLLELVFNFILISILLRKKRNNANDHKKREIYLKGNKFIYMIFIMLALAIYILIGKNNEIINFLFIPVNEGVRIGDINDTSLVIGRQIILIAIFLMFVWVVDHCSKKYRNTQKNIYFYISVIIALVNVSIIVGERRTNQVYTAFCSIWILCYAFPKFKKKILIYVGGTALFVLIMMSIYKFFGAFSHASYSDAIKNSNLNIFDISQILQSYFGGPQDIAVIIEYNKLYNLNIINLLYDFMRSTVPISFFVKGLGHVTSELFNMHIYNGNQATGHIISTVGYSYLYFGVIFPWLFTAINILIAYCIENKLNNSNSYEMMYVWAYVLMRFSFGLIANTPALISSATIMIMTAGVLFKIAEIFKVIRKNYYMK